MTRRTDMAERILHAALSVLDERGVESIDVEKSLRVFYADLDGCSVWKTEAPGDIHRLDVWDGPVLLYLVTWQGDKEPELHGFTPGLWMQNLLGPLGDIGRECFAFERLANAFVEHWQRPAQSEAEAFAWGATLPDDKLQSYGFSDRAEFDRIGETLIAFDEAEQSSTVLH